VTDKNQAKFVEKMHPNPSAAVFCLVIACVFQALMAVSLGNLLQLAREE
jgi:hypothetical protein